MNNLQPFEKHLADQLQQVPIPDREEGWIEMRKLLDRELPEGGTAWSGNRKWWWMGITVAIIIAGLWMSEEFRKNSGSVIAHNIPTNNNSESEKSNASSNRVNDKATPSNSPASAQTEERTPIVSSNPVDKKEQPTKEIFTRDAAEGKKESIANSEKKLNSNNTAHQKISDLTTSSSALSGKNKKGHPNLIEAGTATSPVAAAVPGKEDPRAKTGRGAMSSTGKKGTSDNNIVGVNGANANESELSPLPLNMQTISTSQEFFADPVNELATVPVYSQPLKAEPGKTDKEFVKQLRKESIKADNRKMSARSMKGYSREKDNELTFAAGLALPQSFAISGQQSPAYGVNASSSRVSDYFPVPFFQYHVNSKVFLQTELQFQSPQYTDRLLVYQGQQYTGPSNMLEKNVFIEKLYYFHIPFNIYFSPTRNFYIGSGLQFSSLLSGVATYQYNQYSGSTLQNSTSKVEGFKDDTIASKLSSSEWRYQFDANYYLKRFTFGARYNQALSQFINLQPSPTLPYTIGRNQSFFIYLRYNIWEERKKGGFYSE